MTTEPRMLRWESLTKSAFDRLDRARCVVLVTCSPVEVHGPHLPLGADALEGEGLAERVLRFLPDRHRDVTIVSVGGRSHPRQVERFIDEHGLQELDHLYDNDLTIATAYGIIEEPGWLFVRADGTVEVTTGPLDREAVDDRIAAIGTP